MAYDGMTPGGVPVNAALYKQYQDHVMEMQSNGQAAPNFADWYKMIMAQQPSRPGQAATLK